MDKVEKLSQQAVDTVKEAKKVYDSVLGDVEKRVNYIISFVVSIVGGKVGWWSWQNSTEEIPLGCFEDSYNESSIDIIGEWSDGSKMKFIDKDGHECDLQWGELPTRWLFEDFEDEYTNGLKSYKEKQERVKAVEKEKRIKKEAEKKAVLAAASKKLTKEEMQVLGLKFERKT